MPDDLLDRLDALARTNRETRSGFLRRLAEQELYGTHAAEQVEVQALLEKAVVPGGLGGDAARLIREEREAH